MRETVRSGFVFVVGDGEGLGADWASPSDGESKMTKNEVRAAVPAGETLVRRIAPVYRKGVSNMGPRDFREGHSANGVRLC